MLPTIPRTMRTQFLVIVPLIGISAGVAAYLLQQELIVFASTAIAFLGSLLALAQWLVAQVRESAKSSWEAVKSYYGERDTREMIEISAEIFSGNFTRANIYCNFFEKWGRLRSHLSAVTGYVYVIRPFQF